LSETPREATQRSTDFDHDRRSDAGGARFCLERLGGPTGIHQKNFACSPTSKCGSAESWNPERLAVNEETGDVYVIDVKNDAIQVFDKDGAYEESIKVPAGKGGSFGFQGEYDDIAIDNSGTASQGRIYVCHRLRQVLRRRSRRLRSLGTGLAACRRLAVDPSGEVFSSEYGGDVQERNPTTGALEGSPIVTAATNADNGFIAFNAQDDLYLQSLETAEVNKLAAPAYSFPGTLLPGGGHTDVEVNRNTGRAYTASGSKLLRVYEPDGSQVGLGFESEIAGHYYVGVAPNSKTGRIYVSDTGNDAIEIWDSAPVTLEVFPVGNGKVECDTGSGPGACAASYPEGTELTLVATADPGSSFDGFDGSTGSAASCSTSPCTFALTASTEVFAEFNLIPKYDLTVKKAGTGSGTIACNGGACAAEYEEGAEVTLEAKADSGSTFSGWSGEGCSGTGACKVKMTVARTVTATFTANPTDGGGGGGDNSGGGGTTNPPPPPPPPAEDKLGPCIAKANKAAQRAKKAAKKKQGKAKARAIKAANKRKTKAIKACKAQFG
jgi:List-Bact-rpt repeat protein